MPTDIIIPHTDYTIGAQYSDGSVPSGDTIANTSTETPFVSGDVNKCMPANQLNVNDIIRITARGVISTNSGSQSIRFRIQLGSSTIVYSTGTLSIPGALANIAWKLSADIIVVSLGSSGSIECQGELLLLNGSSSPPVIQGNTSPVTLDMTIDEAIVILAKWGSASSANSITLRTIYCELLRAS